MTDDQLAPLYVALGLMVHTASQVEFAAEYTGVWLTRSETEANKLKGKTINSLCDLVVSYARSSSYLTPSMLAALDAITRDIRDGMEHRNAYVHGYWAEPDGVLSAMNSRAYEKEPTGFRVKPLSVEHLDQLSEELAELGERMLTWLLRAMVLKDPDMPNKIPDWKPDTAPPYPDVPAH